MKREILITSDGSTTIHLPDWDEQYHSKHGAIQEAYHVFLRAGLDKVTVNTRKLTILEIGFGTGLNAFITFYIEELNASADQHFFDKMHEISWEEQQEISEAFKLTKRKQFFQDVADKEAFDLIYFDAFGAKNQPELWTEAIFLKMYEAIRENGVLVTYCAKGSARRAMQAVGFSVERIPGPPGKREMLRATKKRIA